ncbi:MAG: hypothetical protein M5U27_11280 [Gaiella sp.]|nr:hypothetical protein [Gaiella sp.]
MRHLTIRNVPADLGERLQEEKRLRGRSLNQTVLDLLSQALGLEDRGSRSNGLGATAGTWSAAEQDAFERAIADTEQIDEELWR